ncbi:MULTISPECIES: hypothetical protein [Marinomonas]|uniref:Uncharacterized protein n=1 Tax=Marinomonas aquiplantarum TaxID=491951 RepID=A0A366D0J4_9GAMM|nr:hypothetical protein [Marinomonas aquiplantarum]RBO83415.1 hypothetical protein DFP76_104233 [Marinomonas aquiplantarum]
MEHFILLLHDLKQVTLEDIAALPEEAQHVIAEHLEQLQDDLDKALPKVA